MASEFALKTKQKNYSSLPDVLKPNCGEPKLFDQIYITDTLIFQIKRPNLCKPKNHIYRPLFL